MERAIINSICCSMGSRTMPSPNGECIARMIREVANALESVIMVAVWTITLLPENGCFFIVRRMLYMLSCEGYGCGTHTWPDYNANAADSVDFETLSTCLQELIIIDRQAVRRACNESNGILNCLEYFRDHQRSPTRSRTVVVVLGMLIEAGVDPSEPWYTEESFS